MVPKNISNIALFMPRFLGDCINCTPAISLLKQYFPEVTLHLVMRENVVPAFERETQIKFIIDERKQSKLKGTKQLINQLKAAKIDATILFTSTLFDALVAKLSGSQFITGYDTEARAWLLDIVLKMDRHRHYINRYAYLANALCNNSFEQLPQVAINHQALPEIKEQGQVKIGINIASPDKGSRHYSVSQMAEAMSSILTEQPNVLFYLLGAPDEAKTANELAQSFADKVIVNLAGKTSIPVLINTIASLDLLITVDSGPMHIAAAVNTPIVALHSKGTSAFSIVCPKVDNIIVVSTHGAFIRDEDQINDLYPNEISQAALKLVKN